MSPTPRPGVRDGSSLRLGLGCQGAWLFHSDAACQSGRGGAATAVALRLVLVLTGPAGAASGNAEVLVVLVQYPRPPAFPASLRELSSLKFCRRRQFYR
jgi:hypothetical protein